MAIAQALLLAFLGYETCTSEDMIDKFKEFPPHVTIVLARFLCAVILRIILTDETKQGFNMMKYANNHWWKFDDWFGAYMIGFTQMLIVILVESVNLAVLATNTTILDIIMNFTALLVLTEVDNFFY